VKGELKKQMYEKRSKLLKDFKIIHQSIKDEIPIEWIFDPVPKTHQNSNRHNINNKQEPTFYSSYSL